MSKRVLLLCFLSVQAYANIGAYADQSSSKTEIVEESLNSNGIPDPLVETLKNEEDTLTQVQRQKRLFDYFAYEERPFNPILPHYSSFVKRDSTHRTGVFDETVQLEEIRKRVQDIFKATKQYLPPPRPIHVPYIPFYYLPRMSCPCIPDIQHSESQPKPQPEPQPQSQQLPQLQPQSPHQPQPQQQFQPRPQLQPQPQPQFQPQVPPQTQFNPQRQGTNTPNAIPDFTNRVTEIDNQDEDKSNTSSNDYDDGIREISFQPILPNTPLSKPPPPVDHGTVQAGAEPSEVDRTDESTTQFLDIANNGSNFLSSCEKAILKCCHRNPNIECFQSLGCPNPPFRSRLCADNVILDVVNKYLDIIDKTDTAKLS